MDKADAGGQSLSMAQSNHDLTAGSIPGHFRKLAIPTAIGMVFTTLYNVVDVYYAGLISTDAQAGLALSFQVFFIMIALGFGLNTGMSALVGNALGEGQREDARRIAGQGISFGIIVSVAVAVLGYFFAPYLIALISEPGTYRDAANDYLRWLLFATMSFLLAFGANGILAAQGDTVSMQRAQIAAFFANLALNPLFIFGIPGLIGGIGFNGIALSTIVSQTGVLAYILLRVARSDLMTGHRADMRPHLPDFKAIMGQALPASFAMIVMMIGGFVVQFFLKDFGGEAIAAYGVALRIEQLLLLPAFGITGALLPIAAQNFGAKKHDRVREAAWFCAKSGVALMLCASMVLWFAARPAMGIFTDDEDVIRIGASYLHVDGFILPIYVLLFGINSLLQAFKRPMITLWIGIYRQGIGIAVFVSLYVLVFDWGVWGVWLGIATAVSTGLVLALWLTARTANNLIGGMGISTSRAERVT